MDRTQAVELLKKYNKEEFHIRHAYTVEGVMRYFAKELGYDEEIGRASLGKECRSRWSPYH